MLGLTYTFMNINYYNYGQFKLKDFYMYNTPLYLYDIANILKQVKAEFVYNMNKQGSLNDWSKFLFGLEKTMTISEVFDAYKKKQIDRIIEYNRNDVLLETLIYSAIVYVKGGE